MVPVSLLTVWVHDIVLDTRVDGAQITSDVAARRRRRALVTTMLCAAFACPFVAMGLVIARRYYPDRLPAEVQSEDAAATIFDTLLRFLRVSLRTAIALGVVVATGAYLSGAGRMPRALRGWADRTADSAAQRGDTHEVRSGRVGTWTDAHRRRLIPGVLLVPALASALWNHPAVLTVLLLVLILLVVVAVLALLAATGRVGNTATGTPTAVARPPRTPPARRSRGGPRPARSAVHAEISYGGAVGRSAPADPLRSAPAPRQLPRDIGKAHRHGHCL
ncbi:hypothetical protein OG596_19755 [Streptomyces sp. NBC_01102]|uniref:hypothetical protein n=1 Tax=Streptomyces sp. NBC_01102 TaxID=2903749 RepID=UPI00386CAF84|nr:hypothetical protein OG596_19755 [Streptomyces sp. NBC_01102]